MHLLEMHEAGSTEPAQHFSGGALTPPQGIQVLPALEGPIDFTLWVACTYKHFTKRLALFPSPPCFELLKRYVIFLSPVM